MIVLAEFQIDDTATAQEVVALCQKIPTLYRAGVVTLRIGEHAQTQRQRAALKEALKEALERLDGLTEGDTTGRAWLHELMKLTK